MVVSADQILDKVYEEDISEVLIVSYYHEWTISFYIKLTTGFYLIPCQIIYKLDKENIGIKLYRLNYTTKLFSIYKIKKYIKDLDLKFVIITDDVYKNSAIKTLIMQTIKLK